MATIFRAPLYSPRAAPKPPQPATVVSNILLTLLAASAAAAPFAQTDWPRPPSRPAIRDTLSWVPNLQLTTLATTAAPFSPASFNSAARPAAPRAFDASPNLLLTTIGSIPPFVPVDFAAKRGATAQRVDFQQNLLVTTLATPFAQTDWPSSFSARLAGKWDAPQNLQLTTLASVAAPFAQYNWTAAPVSRGAGRDSFINLFESTLAPVATTPFGQFDWPKAPIKWVRLFDVPPNLIDTTLSLVVGKPFTNTDWPRSVGVMATSAALRATTDTIPNLLATTLASPPVIVPPTPGTGGPQSKWLPYRHAIPTTSSELSLNILRTNLFAMAATNTAGISPAWSYTNSFTRGEASPGTAANPARKYWYRGTGNKTYWVKVVLTWTGANVTKMALYFSDDNESTYANMVDDGHINYVLTLVYDGSNNLVSTSWGNAP